MQEIFEVRQSRAKAAFGVVGCLLFVAMGFWVKDLPGDKAHLAGWGSMLFFTAMTPLWLAAAVNPARLTADVAGLSYSSTFRRNRWTWDEIEAVTLFRFRRVTQVELVLRRGGKANLSSAWTMPPETLAERLTGMKSRFGGQAPSRPADAIVM